MKVVSDRIVELSKELIAIPSVSGSERDVAAYIERFLRRFGLEYRRIEADPAQPNLVLHIPGQADELICFNGHMDVLPAEESEGWSGPPFKPRIKEGRLYGRGALDMKGVLAVFLHLIENLVLNGMRPHYNLHFQFVSDEERGAENGSRILAALMRKGELPRPDLVIIGERSELRLRLADRGAAHYRATILGRSAHTAFARDSGINPIYYAAQAILALERPLAHFHPEVGHPVISINIIEGGRVINQVPDKCSFLIDRRVTPDEDVDKVTLEIEQVLKDICYQREELSYRLELISHSRGTRTPKDTPQVEWVRKSLIRVTGGAELYIGWAGTTDARFFREMGIPTVVLGPCGGSYHGPDEYVEIDSLYALAKVYADLICG